MQLVLAQPSPTPTPAPILLLLYHVATPPPSGFVSGSCKFYLFPVHFHMILASTLDLLALTSLPARYMALEEPEAESADAAEDVKIPAPKQVQVQLSCSLNSLKGAI